MTTRRQALFSLVSSAGLLCAGCQRGPELGAVSGQVAWNGEPVPFAFIQFQPIDPRGPYASAYTDAQGHYTLLFSRQRQGATLGTHQVTVRTPTKEEIEVEDKNTGLMTTPKLPKSYQGRRELQFERVVKKGANEIDFDLATSK